MNTFLSIILAYCFLAVLYRYALRPLFKSLICDRMIERKRELEKLAETGKVNREDFAYKFLLGRFKLRDVLAECSVSDFIHFVVSSSPPKDITQGFDRFMKEADQSLIGCHNEFVKDFCLWLALRSPIYMTIGGVIIGGMILFRNLDEATAKRKAMLYADEPIAAAAC